MTKKNLPGVRLVDRDEAAELPEVSDELRLAFTEVAGAAREGLLAMSVSVGMRVPAEMMEEELAAKVGPKHVKIPGRSATRHASAPGSVVRSQPSSSSPPSGASRPGRSRCSSSGRSRPGAAVALRQRLGRTYRGCPRYRTAR